MAFQDLQCGYDCREYTNFGSEIDLVADSPEGKDAARSIEVLEGGDGTLIVETVVGETRTLTASLLVGRELVVGIRKIKVGTNVDRVLVIW